MSAAPFIGRPLDRVDGRLKVTGHATYVAEFAPDEIAIEMPAPIAGMLEGDTGGDRI